MKELKVGQKFDVLGNWFKEITEVIRIDGNHALARVIDDIGDRGFCHFEKRGENWESYIFGYDIDGLLYPVSLR